jgi:hypothetical protein
MAETVVLAAIRGARVVNQTLGAAPTAKPVKRHRPATILAIPRPVTSLGAASTRRARGDGRPGVVRDGDGGDIAAASGRPARVATALDCRDGSCGVPRGAGGDVSRADGADYDASRIRDGARRQAGYDALPRPVLAA